MVSKIARALLVSAVAFTGVAFAEGETKPATEETAPATPATPAPTEETPATPATPAQ